MLFRSPRLRLPHWWNASFSGLTRRLGDDSGAASWHASNEHEREVDTEKLRLAEDDWDVPKPQEPWQSFGAGARYGTLLHDLLQWQAERDWPLAQGLEGPEWRALMERQPLLTDAERALLSPWLRAITVTPLPLAGANDVVLGSLKQPAQWAEMPFHFGVTPLPVQRMDQLIRDDLFAGRDRPTLQPAVLSGMVNGFIDLVFHHDGRYWVLDYKSNRLDHYGTEALQNALLEKRYDVQSVLYMLALHRLLKVRLSDYDPARHLGGAAYLFIRGIGSAGAGVVMQQPSAQLITTLDVLMGADAGGMA